MTRIKNTDFSYRFSNRNGFIPETVFTKLYLFFLCALSDPETKEREFRLFRPVSGENDDVAGCESDNRKTRKQNKKRRSRERYKNRISEPLKILRS
jgi:hypothetical protein